MKTMRLALGFVLLLPLGAVGQPNGKLQLHFMDVGQGDGVLVVSPRGETVLIDGGSKGKEMIVNPYLARLGCTNLDYFVVSHYHEDHIGCAANILTAPVVSHLKAAYDRGDSPTKTDSYTAKFAKDYRGAVQGKRRTVEPGGPIENRSITLDAGSGQPVEIEFIAANGNGAVTKTGKISENDLSVVCVVRYGQFSAELGGDLSGSKKGGYTDVESAVARDITKPVSVYKVHHHGSGFSSNTNWLQAINPVVGIISCGTKNKHKHPEESALTRLIDCRVDTYWTETGSREKPEGAGIKGAEKMARKEHPKVALLPKAKNHQRVGGNIVVQAAATSDSFDVITDKPKSTNTYRLVKPAHGWGEIVSGTVPAPKQPLLGNQGASLARSEAMVQ